MTTLNTSTLTVALALAESNISPVDAHAILTFLNGFNPLAEALQADTEQAIKGLNMETADYISAIAQWEQ
jgi:hypothetical protein